MKYKLSILHIIQFAHRVISKIIYSYQSIILNLKKKSYVLYDLCKSQQQGTQQDCKFQKHSDINEKTHKVDQVSPASRQSFRTPVFSRCCPVACLSIDVFCAGGTGGLISASQVIFTTVATSPREHKKASGIEPTIKTCMCGW